LLSQNPRRLASPLNSDVSPHMPYIVSFVKPLDVADREQYINDCCLGGDIVLEYLLPALRTRYGSDLQSTQEDWGWFVWFEQLGVKLAVDVHTNDHTLVEFQLVLTSRRPRLLLGAKIQDTPELEQLRQLVVSELQAWPVEQLSVERVDEKYMPV
jgi:hypothetical protein